MAALLREKRRRDALSSLLGFVRYTKPDYIVGPHHPLICEKLEAVERGDIKRLMIFTPPRHGKSELVSRKWPARYIGKFPASQFISASYGDDLATDFGRDVRNLIASEEYRRLYPGTSLASDSAAKGKWHTTAGGIYISTSVGKGITGRGSDVLNIDDPVKDRIEAESETVRKNIWDWFASTAYTRLMPNAAIVLTMCMVGETNVRMADGTHKQLRDIVSGDKVATYEKGSIGNSYIVDIIDQGEDFVYEITTQSGGKTRANARHPFLVNREGKLEWIRLQSLREGDRAILANKIDRITSNTDRSSELDANLTDATVRQDAKASAHPTTTKPVGKTASVRHPTTRQTDARQEYKPDTASAKTTITQPGKFAGFSATTAISQLATEKMKPSCDAPLNTSEFILDPISSIVEVGLGRVFDVQVARTENFIADGFVSHNTRWHEDDLAGRLLEASRNGGEHWEVLNLPAFANSQDDPIGRRIDEPLWPERYGTERLTAIRGVIGEREFGALYQQEPRPLGTSYFDEQDCLVNGEPVSYPAWCDYVFAIVDTATKTGAKHDGTAVSYWAYISVGPIALVCLDWDVAQIEGSLLEVWLPNVFTRLEHFAGTINARYGSNGAWIEDKASGMVLLQHAERRGWPATPIDSKITAVGKDERAISVAGHVTASEVKLSEFAYKKISSYKGRNGNHFLMQVFRFQIGVKDQEDDLLDTFTYAIATTLGNSEGLA